MKDTNALYLELGHEGPKVLSMQRQLVTLGYKIVPDGKFGKKTVAAVRDFQAKNGLVVDGIAGIITSRALFEGVVAPPLAEVAEAVEKPKMVFPVKITKGRAQMNFEFGNPDSSLFEKTYIVGVTLPGDIFFDGKPKNIQVHYLIVDILMKAVRGMIAAGKKFSVCDGGYVNRTVRGSTTKKSTHAFGISCDFDYFENPLGEIGAMSPSIVKIWEESGWTWGGGFRRKDYCHFQAVSNY